MVGARRRTVTGAAGIFALGLALSLIPASSGAQTAAQAGCATRTVAVSVTGKDGKQVENLTPANFRAKASGGPVRVLSARMAGGNGRAVLVLDESPSLWGQEAGLPPFVHALADDFLSHRSHGRQVAFVGFSTKINAETSFTLHAARLLDFVPQAALPKRKTPCTRGKTALWDTLSSTLTLFGQVKPGDAVYVITDGRDNHSKESPRQVTDEYLRRGVRLFVLLPVAESDYMLKLLARMVGKAGGGSLVFPYTGGIVLGLETPPEYAVDAWRRLRQKGQFRELRPVLDNLYAQMFDEYLLEIRLAKPRRKETKWKLKLAGLPK